MDIGLWDQAFSHLEEAVEQGLVSEKELDRAVLLVLEQKFALGLFEHPYLGEEEPETSMTRLCTPRAWSWPGRGRCC